MKQFYRSYTDRKIWGMCGGLGRYTSTDPFIWRLLFFGLVFTSFPIILVYVIGTIASNSIEFTD
jgi:phage shock protein PspC (stress-responsive transcriptional regulator)